MRFRADHNHPLALGAPPVAVLAALMEGAFGNRLAFTETIVKATPLVFTELAISIALEGALWNIGAEGQLIVGALAAARSARCWEAGLIRSRFSRC
jgi:ABC-type uncharacterized transport system permease subunit